MRVTYRRLTVFVAGLIFLAAACTQAQLEGTAPDASPAPEVSPSPTPAPLVSEVPTPPPIASPPSSPASPTASKEPAALYTPEGPPPKLDTSISSVSLDEVVFDTFRGGYIPLSDASDALIEQLRDAIKPIYEPRYDPVERGDWLRDDDVVIGYASESGAFAYPIKILNLHEIVNDLIDGVPVLISYCPLCASAVAYSRELGGRILLFGNTSALHESDLVMYYHETGSYWFQVLGEAIVGPLTGKRLVLLPSVTTTWGRWKEQHPETKVLSRNLGLLSGGLGSPYARDPFVGYDERLNRGQFVFPVTEEKLDGRLPAGQKVFAVQVGQSHKAYALPEDSDWVINDEVDGKSIVVIARVEGPTAASYVSAIDGRTLTFRLNDGAVLDSETGTTWDDSGRAISGPMAGAQLNPVPSRTSCSFRRIRSLGDRSGSPWPARSLE